MYPTTAQLLHLQQRLSGVAAKRRGCGRPRGFIPQKSSSEKKLMKTRTPESCFTPSVTDLNPHGTHVSACAARASTSVTGAQTGRRHQLQSLTQHSHTPAGRYHVPCAVVHRTTSPPPPTPTNTALLYPI